MAQIYNSRRGRYILGPQPIGQGGQAQVFSAQERSTNGFVALKRLLSKRDPEALSRMRREIEIQTAVKHPHIMPVLDHSSRYCWYTMPLAEKSLTDLLLPINDDELLIEIVESCAKGLAAAHEKGYVHRDLTPNNILQIKDEAGLRWVVSDWGLVRIPKSTTIAITRRGELIGTLGFMAPEMWEDAHLVDARADVYSLGRVLAYCLTGKWPKPNISLSLPNSKWATLVSRMTMTDVDQRVQNMGEVLKLLEIIKHGAYIEPSSYVPFDFSAPLVGFQTDETYQQENEVTENSEYNPVQAKFVIAQRAKVAITALKERDISKLADLAHPIKGIRFSPYPSVSEEDRVLLPEQIKLAFEDEDVYLWGYGDGNGFPLEMTFRTYYDHYVYSRDFINAERINYNELSGIGNTINNALQFYVDGIVVEYHFIGFEPQYGGMDWEGLQLAFQELKNTWYLVGIIHESWTI